MDPMSTARLDQAGAAFRQVAQILGSMISELVAVGVTADIAAQVSVQMIDIMFVHVGDGEDVA